MKNKNKNKESHKLEQISPEEEAKRAFEAANPEPPEDFDLNVLKRYEEGLLEIKEGSKIISRKKIDISNLYKKTITLYLNNHSIKAFNWIKNESGLSKAKILEDLLKDKNELKNPTYLDFYKIPIQNKKKVSIKISQKIRNNLNEVSEELRISRNQIVHNLIIMNVAIQKMTNEKTINLHKKALKLINSFFEKSNQTYEKLSNILEKEDPILDKFLEIDTRLMNLSIAIEDSINNNKPVTFID